MRVLRLVYEWQFQGRTLAVTKRLAEGVVEWGPVDDDRVWRFKSVPALALLTELYEPGSDNQRLVGDLWPAVEYLATCGLIERMPAADGRVEVTPNFRVPHDFVLTPYVRPDGVVVTAYWDLLTEKQLAERREFSTELAIARSRRANETSRNRLWYVTAVCVGKDRPIYAVARPYLNRVGVLQTTPALHVVLGRCPQGLGYSPDDVFAITRDGIVALEGTIGREGARVAQSKQDQTTPVHSHYAAISQEPTPQTGSVAGEHAGASRISSKPTDRLKPAHARAKALYLWAMEHIEGAENVTYAQLFDSLTDDPRCGGEGLPDNAATFARYCRAAGIRRSAPQRVKGPTRSVRRSSNL